MSEPSRFRRLYGDGPLHLLVLLGCFALTGYAVTRLLTSGTATAVRVAVWFVGAAVVHDLVLSPLYALADRTTRPLRSRRTSFGAVSAQNFVRFPAAISLLLLLLWLPLIFQRSEGVYQAKVGLRQDPYLERWLLVTGALFLGAALLYALAVRRSRTGGRPT